MRKVAHGLQPKQGQANGDGRGDDEKEEEDQSIHHASATFGQGVEGISNLLQQVPVERILFGSHLPLFLLESALLKLQESDLTPAQLDAITHSNAERLLES